MFELLLEERFQLSIQRFKRVVERVLIRETGLFESGH